MGARCREILEAGTAPQTHPDDVLQPAAMKIAFRPLLAVLGLWFAVSAHAAPGVYAVAGPWIDDSAKPFRLETLSGGYTVATMAYGACRRVCSTSVRRIEELHALAER